MNKFLIGIEIGHKNIKIVYGIKKRNSFKHNLCEVIALKEDTIENGILLNSKILAEIISKFIKTHQIKTKNVLLNIQSTLIITRITVVPKVKEDELQKLVAFQKQEYFPINISDYRVDYKINIKNKDNYEVILVAVPNSLINTYVDLFKVLHLNILNIDINSNSLAELFKSKQIIAVIDIGYKTTNLTIISDKRILFSRVILYGVLEQDNILIELNKYLDFYKSKFTNMSITKLYLIGGGAYSNDISKNIISVFDNNTILGTDLNIIVQSNNKDILYFISLIGLLNKNYKDKFNLLPDWYLDELKNKKLKKTILSEVIVIISILAVFFISTQTIIIKKEKLLRNINLKLKDNKFVEVDTIHNKLLLTQDKLNKQKNILYTIEKNSNLTTNILDNIIDCTNNKVYLNAIVIDNNSKHIVLNGVADNDALNQVLEYVSNLDSLKLFENIDFNIPFKDKFENISFTIELDILNI